MAEGTAKQIVGGRRHRSSQLIGVHVVKPTQATVFALMLRQAF